MDMRQQYLSDNNSPEFTTSEADIISDHEMDFQSTHHDLAAEKVQAALPKLRARGGVKLDVTDIEAAYTLESIRKATVFEDPDAKWAESFERSKDNGGSWYRRDTVESVSHGTLSNGLSHYESTDLIPKATIKQAFLPADEVIRQGRLGPGRPVSAHNNALAIKVYNITLAKAKARHSDLTLTDLLDSETFILDDVQAAITITNLHSGMAFGLEDLYEIVAKLSYKGYTNLDIILAIKSLWQVDFLSLIADPDDAATVSLMETLSDISEGTLIDKDDDEMFNVSSASTEIAEEEEQEVKVLENTSTTLGTAPKRTSTREKGCKYLKYNTRYHPIDDFIQPSLAKKMKAQSREGRVG